MLMQNIKTIIFIFVKLFLNFLNFQIFVLFISKLLLLFFFPKEVKSSVFKLMKHCITYSILSIKNAVIISFRSSVILL